MEGTGQPVDKDLAESKDPEHWLTWVQVPLGSVVMNYGSVPVADVLALRKSYVQPTFVIYEVKISRSDFNADVNRGKYQRYFNECGQLYFAAPAGLIKKNEVPEGTGLIVRGDKGWQTLKAAPRRAHKLDEQVLLKVLMRGYERRMIEWKQYDRLKLLEYKGLKDASLKHGIKIAQDLGSATDLIQRADEIKDKVGEVLGKNYRTVWDAVYSLQSDVEGLFSQKRYSAEVMQLVRIIEMLFQGTRFFAEGAPRRLRDLADELEAKFSKDGGRKK